MSATLITLIVNALLALFVISGFLWGLGRGFKKSIVRFAYFVGFVVIFALISPLISQALLGIKIGSLGSLQEIIENAEEKPKFNIPKKLVFCIVGALILIVFSYVYINSLLFESTDDAYIESHLTQISPKVSGQVVAVYIDDNQKVKEGDIVNIDYVGTKDGVAFDGGTASGYDLTIGSGQFIPGFEEGMIGLKVGEAKDIKVTFPAEYGAKHLAGKDAVFKVKLHEIQEQKKAELNEETLKKILPNEEKPTKQMLEDSIKEQIKTNKFITLLNGEIKEKFADALDVSISYLMGWEDEDRKYDYVDTDLIAKFIKDKSRMDFLITYEQLNEENKNKVNDIASALLLAQEKL